MRLTQRQIKDLRAECGKGGLDAALLAAQLLEIVEHLQTSLDAAEQVAAEAKRAAGEAQRAAARAQAALQEERSATSALLGTSCEACRNAHRTLRDRLRTPAIG